MKKQESRKVSGELLDWATRTYRAATKAERLLLYITEDGLYDLWVDLCGGSAEFMKKSSPPENGDEIWGMTAIVVHDAGPLGFFVTASPESQAI